MAKGKCFTDLKQSKRLAEILPFESADMYFNSGDETEFIFGKGYYEDLEDWSDDGRPRPADVPCWSLAALLTVIKNTGGYTMQGSNECFIDYELGDRPWKIITKSYDNEVDACYELIIKLHELNLL